MTTSEKNESKSSSKSNKKSVKAVSVNTSDDASKESAEQRQKQLGMQKSSLKHSLKNKVSNHIRWKLFNKSIKTMLRARGETRVDGWRVPILRNDQQLTVIVVHPNALETQQVFSFNELKLAGLWREAPGKREAARKRATQQFKRSKQAPVSEPMYTGYF